MIINFRIREISRSAHKLTRTFTLILKKKWFPLVGTRLVISNHLGGGPVVKTWN